MFAFLLIFLFAGQSFGPSAIWKPDANFRQTVISACQNRGAKFDACFADQMKAAGASADALAFTHAVHDEAYMQSFRPVGPIGIAVAVYPFRANENDALLIVNGEPPTIDVDALDKLPADQMRADPAYQAMLKNHADATLFPGDRSSTDALLAVGFADGSREVVAGYRVQAGCHACAVLGLAFFGFEFDPQGKWTGTKFNGFTTEYSGDRANARQIVRVTPNSTFTLLLPGNRTTGYSWALTPTKGKKALQSLGQKYEAQGNAVGRGGEEQWSFRAPSSGNFTLNFGYKRPWEKNTAPAKSLEISVQIQQ